MQWREGRFWVDRVEMLLLEVREIPGRYSWRVLDGLTNREVGELAADGFEDDEAAAKLQCQTAAKSYLSLKGRTPTNQEDQI